MRSGAPVLAIRIRSRSRVSPARLPLARGDVVAALQAPEVNVSRYVCTGLGCDNGRPDHQWLCRSCVDQLTEDLAAIPALWRELTTTLSRQDVIGGDASRKSAEAGLPYKASATEARYVLSNTVGTWARVLAENAGVATPLRPVRWLLLNVQALVMHEAAGEAADEIHYVVTAAYRAIDRPPELLLAGPCPTEDCEAFLYAKPDDIQVQCEACTAVYTVADRREWMINAASVLRVTSTVALGWVRLLMDKTIPPGTWRSWQSRGKIHAAGLNHDGQPIYRFGDVRDLAVRWMSSKAA